MYLAGFITFLGLLFLLSKIDRQAVKRALGYDLYIDILLTSFVAWLLAGTYSGMIAAMLAGLAFSVVLYILKQFIGYERLERVRCHECRYTHWQWRTFPPKIQRGLFNRYHIRARN